MKNHPVLLLDGGEGHAVACSFDAAATVAAEVERARSTAEGSQASEVQSLREELAAQRRAAAAGSAMSLLAAAAREHEQVAQGQAKATAKAVAAAELAAVKQAVEEHSAAAIEAVVRAEASSRHTRSNGVWAAKRAVVTAGRAVVAAERAVTVVPARAARLTKEAPISVSTSPQPREEVMGTVALLEAAAQGASELAEVRRVAADLARAKEAAEQLASEQAAA